MTDLEDADTETPWFLRGNFAPVDDELFVTDLPVTGAIPPTLSGRYLRNGSNPRAGNSSHWFFGDGMVHGIRLEGGRAAWYRNRWVRTTKLEQGLDQMAAVFDPTASAANTHVLAHAGRIWALEEQHLPYELTPDLDTVGPDDFGGQLRTAFTAHPKHCPATGELHFFGYSAVPPYLTYHVLDASGQLVHSAPIQVPGGTMMHDFMITEQHAVFMDLPVVFDFARRGDGGPLRWSDTYGARVGILPRRSTDADVRWFEVEPCYVFHPLNAWTEGDQVICDVGRHPHMWRDSMHDQPPAVLHRWRFDLSTGSVHEERLDDASHALPRVDERRVGRRHRYGWAVAARDPGGRPLTGDPGVVVKWDLESGTKEVVDFGPAGFPGEFVFVPADDGAGEDEGWVMGIVHDEREGRSDLVICDASTPTAPPVARVHLPRRVPYGFHGSWIDDNELTWL